MIGKTISHYKILEKLGEGSMGEVFLAEDTKLKRKVALKFLPKKFSRDPEAKKRFMSEARSASNLDHNNICVIHDINETDDGQLFISMNYYKGETLQQKLKKEQLTIKETLNYITQIAKGLEHAHKKEIVHCDIKPGNILITDDETPKIVDFGIAKVCCEVKLINTDGTSGTMAYMSPEQASNLKFDDRTDIWSLGVVFYEMLTKQMPFKDNYNEALMYSIINEEPESIASINPDVPPELEKIVFKMLKKNPDKRYKSINELLSDIKKYKKGKLSNSTKAKTPIWRIPAYIISVVIIGVLLYISFFSKDDTLKSIAVLPFTTIDRTEEGEIFSAGMHDDILSQVAKIHDLKVVSRTSVMRYKDTDKNIKEIAQELGVETILEGSVRRVGDKVRIVAQLINAKTDDHLWAETYDRDYVDIFALQTDVAENIALALKATLTPEEISSIEKAPTENMEAYDYYLKGKYYSDVKIDREARMKAAELFEKAVELDPRFTLAYAWLAVVDFILYENIYWDPTPERLEKGKFALEQATILDPNLPEVHFAQARYYALIENDNKKAVIEYLKALEGRPNDSHINRDIGISYEILGEWDKAEKYLLKAYEVDPHGLNMASSVASYYMRMHEWRKAEYYIDKAIVSRPEVAESYYWKAIIVLMGYGDTEKASRSIDNGIQFSDDQYMLEHRLAIDLRLRRFQESLDLLEQFPDFLNYFYYKGIAYWFMGQQDQAKTYLDSARMDFESHIQTAPFNIANYGRLGVAYAGLEMNEEAIQTAKKAIEIGQINKNALSAPESHIWLAYIYSMAGEKEKAIDEIELILSIPYYLTSWELKFNPFYDSLRDNPRFQELLEKYSE